MEYGVKKGIWTRLDWIETWLIGGNKYSGSKNSK